MNTLKSAAFLVLILWAISPICGCSNNTAKETLRIDENGLYYRSEVNQCLVAYFTTTKQIEHVTPLSSTVVGEIDSAPDPNSVDAIGGAIGELINKIMKGK